MPTDTKHTPFEPGRRLLVVAAANEARAVLDLFGIRVGASLTKPAATGLQRTGAILGAELPGQAITSWSVIELARIDLLVTGVGKANATGAVVAAAANRQYGSIINIGIGGSLPCNPTPVPIGQVVLGTVAHFADEGVQTPAGFLPLAHLGFACGFDGADAVKPDQVLFKQLETLADVSGGIATVSVCSGTDALARQIAERTGAIAEGMEGAGVLLAAAHLGIPAAEFRVISNTTGDRSGQVWDIKTAMKRLATLAVSLA
ncbi:MAG: futalosine hydrolase [Planctomycetota bacterium]|nr:futalosine hydrolase [Planctomycetota bacterium]